MIKAKGEEGSVDIGAVAYISSPTTLRIEEFQSMEVHLRFYHVMSQAPRPLILDSSNNRPP